MENISLSLPKRSFSNTGFTSHKSIYEDVFGSHPKMGLPNLAPRFEDYSEIFGGFHTSQSSSIPVLHLPLIDSEISSLHFDVDYNEVFGGSEGFDFTVSLEDFVGHSSGGYDSGSSDDPWSPAQSGSLSEELDPLGGSDNSQMLSDGDLRQSLESINKQTASYSKSSHINAETVLTASGHVTNFSAVPGYTFSLHESHVSWDVDDEGCSIGITNNTNHSREYGARVIEKKQYKCSSNSSCSGSDTHRSDSKPLKIDGNSTSQNKPFVRVCDISLRTKPSRLPPPSRPPPVLVVKNRECDKQEAELKPCQLYTSDRLGDCIAPPFVDMEINASMGEVNGHENEVEAEFKHKDSSNKTEEFQRTFEDVEGAEMRELIQERTEAERFEIQHSGCFEKRSENRPEWTYELKENGVTFGDSKSHRDGGDKSYITAAFDKSADRHLDAEKDMEASKLIVNESASGMALDQARYDKDHKLIHELDVNKERYQGVSKNEKNHLRFRMAETEAGNEEEDFETTGNMKLSPDTCLHEVVSEHGEESEPIQRDGHDVREVEWDLDNLILIDGDKLKVSEEGDKVDEVTATKVLGNHDNVQMLKSTQRAFSPEANGDMKTKPNSSTYESEAGKGDTLVVGGFHEFSKNKDESQEKNTQSATDNTAKSPSVPKQMLDSNTCGSGKRFSRVTVGKVSSGLGYSHGEGQNMNNAQFTVKRVDINDNCNRHQVITESILSGGKTEDPSSLKQYNGPSSKKDAISQPFEVKHPNMNGNLAGRDQNVGERTRRETATENEHMRKLEEEREREREREKDRMAVDKAALEARERSYFEARERAERAAVERTTAEVRQRALAEAQERLEKASAEARLRTDRAAVERATAEARQRAAEKLMAHKSAYAHRDPVERSVPDRFSASSKFTDTRQSSLPSDTYFQGTGVSNRLRYSYSSAHNGAESESPQRCKARLERYRRTSERAASALAEKNRRDLLAQREREERNRVAETLDAEVKRWSSGKQGNLRALLSTLQYILGPDSGWHPVSLTEVITSAAVKKAYRRATLCVHPDKLQQRGATIQQKFICEKVFDLLKEAWNKFNSEER